MSEINFLKKHGEEAFNTFDMAHQLIDMEPEKDLSDLIRDLNYYESAKNNLTKNPEEALAILDKTIAGTRHLLFRGKDKQLMEGLFHEILKIKPVNISRAEAKLQEIDTKDFDKLYAFVITKNLVFGVVMEVPENVKS